MEVSNMSYFRILGLITNIAILSSNDGIQDLGKTRGMDKVGPKELLESEIDYFLIIGILIYLYHKDDDVFSYKERRKVRKAIRNSRLQTTRQTRRELRWMLRNEYSESRVLKILLDYDISKKKLASIIVALENQFTTEEEHLYNLRYLYRYLLSDY